MTEDQLDIKNASTKRVSTGCQNVMAFITFNGTNLDYAPVYIYWDMVCASICLTSLKDGYSLDKLIEHVTEMGQPHKSVLGWLVALYLTDFLEQL